MINSKYYYMQEGYKAYNTKFLVKDFLIMNWDNLSQEGKDKLFDNNKLCKPCAITQDFVQNKSNWNKPIKGLEYVADSDLLKYTFILSDVLIEVYKPKIDVYMRNNSFILITDLSNKNIFKEVAFEICTLNRPNANSVDTISFIESLSEELQKYTEETYGLMTVYYEHQEVKVYFEKTMNESSVIAQICFFLKGNFYLALDGSDVLYCNDIYSQKELLEVFSFNNGMQDAFCDFYNKFEQVEKTIRKEINQFISNYFITAQFLHVSINNNLKITHYKTSNYLKEILEYEKTLSDADVILNLTIPLE